MRDCGDCQACCQGWLVGNAHGIDFGYGKSCGFLVGGCTIYSARPAMCSNFFCAWAQELFPEWMQPNLCKVLISVENWTQGQYLKCLEMGQKMSDEVLLHILEFCKKNNAPYALQFEGIWKLGGPNNFIEEVLSKSNYIGCKNQLDIVPK